MKKNVKEYNRIVQEKFNFLTKKIKDSGVLTRRESDYGISFRNYQKNTPNKDLKEIEDIRLEIIYYDDDWSKLPYLQLSKNKYYNRKENNIKTYKDGSICLASFNNSDYLSRINWFPLEIELFKPHLIQIRKERTYIIFENDFCYKKEYITTSDFSILESKVDQFLESSK